ncbi:hypothetical protein EUGRSUZ_E01287 [Eucalyptus grandis]|uniref:Uncharacterized protein n=2 Tax=Eucalyptus grandis TaxID=71139 RepID=A0ACC3KW41_EUCGR|nr:hypothetical protein EUGRSUZ_E01287 [Eucalyptus grandis]
MSSTDNIIILQSSGGESFAVEKAVARQSRTIAQMIEMDVPADGIPLPNVTGKILSKVIDYCKMHVVDTDRDSSVAGDDFKAWDAEFVKVDLATLFDLMLYHFLELISVAFLSDNDFMTWGSCFVNAEAANYLNIKGLLDLTCQTVADMTKGKTPEGIAKTFGIKKDFMPKEEEDIRVLHCRSGMDFFCNAKAVCLRSCDGQYLVVVVDEVVILHDGETRLGESTWQEETGRQDSTRWSVEFIDNTNSFLRLKSCYGKYLTASDQPSLFGMTGCKVLLSLPSLLDSSLELEPVMEGTHVKLRTHYDTFLRANRDHPMYPNSITHNLPHRTTILWDVEVVEREEGTATNIDDKASKEGSSSNSDDKASSVTKRHHKTGEGSSVYQKSFQGIQDLIRER